MEEQTDWVKLIGGLLFVAIGIPYLVVGVIKLLLLLIIVIHS